MNIYEAAIRVATELHAGVLDKNNEPYILHPIRVSQHEYMGYVDSDEDYEVIRAAAVLHDVIEDVEGMTEGKLYGMLEEAAGATTDYELAEVSRVVEIVGVVTKMPEEKGKKGYMQFIKRILSYKNPLPEWIKRADIADNTDPDRLEKLKTSEREYLEKKYADALAYMDGDERP